MVIFRPVTSAIRLREQYWLCSFKSMTACRMRSRGRGCLGSSGMELAFMMPGNVGRLRGTPNPERTPAALLRLVVVLLRRADFKLAEC